MIERNMDAVRKEDCELLHRWQIIGTNAPYGTGQSSVMVRTITFPSPLTAFLLLLLLFLSRSSFFCLFFPPSPLLLLPLSQILTSLRILRLSCFLQFSSPFLNSNLLALPSLPHRYTSHLILFLLVLPLSSSFLNGKLLLFLPTSYLPLPMTCTLCLPPTYSFLLFILYSPLGPSSLAIIFWFSWFSECY